MSDPRYCIIGAGYVGNGVARAFKQAGISYDQLEATDHIDGNWAHGVYDSTHLISSRAGTAYAGATYTNGTATASATKAAHTPINKKR